MKETKMNNVEPIQPPVKDTIVMGIVETQEEAERIVGDLHRTGFAPDAISVLFPNSQDTRGFALENSTKAPEGAVAGAGAGGIVGGALGVLVGIGALAIPGLGPFIAAGPLLAGLSGIAAGMTVGGLTGALVGLGIPEIEAKAYEGRLRNGNMLIAAHASSADLEKRAKVIFARSKAHDVSTTSPSRAPNAPS